MPTYIKLIEGDALTVREEYRHVYEKLLAAGWKEPCEFTEGAEEPRQVTVNPVYVVFVRAA
jgi:hypothetical protein